MDALVPDNFYHIYNHGNGHENLFREQENYRYFLQQYTRHIGPIAETYAYCLMPNHFHLLIKVREAAELKDLPGFENLEGLTIDVERFMSQQFSNLFNSYTKAFNKKYQRAGSLFRKNYKRRLIDNDAYLRNVIAYIHLNPLKHQFVVHMEDWKWSSYQAIVSTAPTAIQRGEVLRLFGGPDSIKTDRHAKQDSFLEYEQIEQAMLL